jgi:hypothetical protein
VWDALSAALSPLCCVLVSDAVIAFGRCGVSSQFFSFRTHFLCLGAFFLSFRSRNQHSSGRRPRMICKLTRFIVAWNYRPRRSTSRFFGSSRHYLNTFYRRADRNRQQVEHANFYIYIGSNAEWKVEMIDCGRVDCGVKCTQITGLRVL